MAETSKNHKLVRVRRAIAHMESRLRKPVQRPIREADVRALVALRELEAQLEAEIRRQGGG